MKKQAHLAVTLIVSVIVVWLGLNFNFLRSWYTSIPLIIVALFSTLLPDILEPGKTINHRKFFHSRRMFSFLSIAVAVSFALIFFKNKSYYFYALFFFLGYWLHLAADMTTSRLPK